MSQLTRKLIRENGVRALYNGVSASIFRQMTSSTARFGIFEAGKQYHGSSDLKNIGILNLRKMKDFVLCFDEKT